MKRNALQMESEYMKIHTRKKWWQKIVTALSVVVVFCTTYALILPAITLEKTAYCGITEHTHSAACYAEAVEAKTLTCQLEEHTHDTACFQAPTMEAPAPTVAPQVAVPSAPAAVPNAAVSANGADAQPAAEEPQQTIQLGVPMDVVIPAGQTVKLSFTPELAHDYLITSEKPSNLGTYQRMEYTIKYTTTTFYGSDPNFAMAYNMSAGVTYELSIKSPVTVTVPVMISYGAHNYQQTDDGRYVCMCGSEPEAQSGTCGESLTWTFDNGILTISGTGAMYDYRLNSMMPWYSFKNAIQQVVVGEGATSIGDRAFDRCTALTDVTLPSSLTEIGTYAFYNCSSLTEIDIPEGVTSIGTYAFYNCSSLAEIDIPEGVTGIGECSFENCTALTAVTLPGSLRWIGASAFSRCSSLTDIQIPEGVTSIYSHAFYSCSGLTMATLPDSLCTIGESAFGCCSSLKDIVIPGSVTAIANDAFYNCDSLTSATISEGVTKIGRCAFQSCASLNSVSLPSSLKTIEDSAFNYCVSLTDVRFPEGLTTLGSNAFRSCTGLTSIAIPEGVTEIGSSAFKDCTSLNSVSLPSSLRTIGSEAFSSTGLTSIIIPENVTSIGSNPVSGCDSLKTIYWMPTADVSLAKSYTKHPSFQLVLCPNSKLTQTQLEKLLEWGCAAIDLPEGHYLTLSALHAEFLNGAFAKLPSESLYYVDAQSALYRVDETAGTASLAYCPAGLTSYTVPAQLPQTDGHGPLTVTGADSYAFYEASDLTELHFEAPQAITQLRDFAFYHAQNLASINGETMDTAVLAKFPNAQVGTGLFEKTKIGHSNTAVPGDKITLAGSGLVVSIETTRGTNRTPAVAEDNTLLFYTGETVKTSISVSNPTDSKPAPGTVLRVYYRMENDEGELNYKPGTYVIETGKKGTVTLRVLETAVPNCYCLELEHPAEGDTVYLTLEGQYPSPSSGGGTATIWGAILTQEQVDALGSALAPKEKSHDIDWVTRRDTFPVTKRQINTSTAKLGGDGKGGAYVTQLDYMIDMQRTGDTVEGMGKDHVVSVDFEDVLTLPEGMRLTQAVREAIEKGTYTVRYESMLLWQGWTCCSIRLPNGTVFMKIKIDGSSKLIEELAENVFLSLDEGQPVISWTFQNKDVATKEISNLRFYVGLTDSTLEIPKLEDNRTYEITNTVTATQHFSHSGDVLQQDSCTTVLTPEAGTLELTKEMDRSDARFGEKVAITLTVKNPNTGIAPPAHTLYDSMPDILYMTAEQMAEVLTEDHRATIKISKATLCKPLTGQNVTGIDGQATGQTSQQNTGDGTRHNGLSGTDPAQLRNNAVISLAWNESGQLTITQDSGEPVICEPTGEAIQQVLDGWGYLVTRNAQYTVTWDLRENGQSLCLVGGMSIQRKINATFKDSFMYLASDRQYEADFPPYYISNYATLVYGNDLKKTDSDSAWPSKDFYLTKGWSASGKEITADTRLEQGDVLDYTLSIRHYGSAHYDLLPLVDHMEGAQALLAPVSLNETTDWAASCPIVTLKDGSRYYLLKDPRTYTHVWTSPDQMADTVTVTQTDSGRDTLIKWYFTDYDGTRSDAVKYHAMVCPQDVLPEGTKAFSLDNEVWLGDHESHRLYNTLPGWTGTVLGFDKKIVEKVGDDGGWSFSHIKEGSAVVYRLTVYGLKDQEGKYQKMTLTGDDLYDALPKSVQTWRWNKDRVLIEYRNADVTNGDQWSITEAQSDQQFLRWDRSFQMTFTERADIYVTLRFPKGDPWVDFANAYGTTRLVNTFYVLGAQASVTHDLSIPGEVRLQKGVYSSGYKGYMSGQEDARWYYSNSEDGKYYVTYYVTLYNGGRTNLYVTEIQDRLPRGFTYAYLGDRPSYGGVAVYKDAEETQRARGVPVNFRYTTRVENGVQYITFQLTPSWPDEKLFHYDEEREMYYLKPGEYLYFYYSVQTNKEPDTDPEATNIVSMRYHDICGGGVKLANSTTKVGQADQYRPNDGGCEIYDAGQAHSLGFTGGESDTQWLTSQVTVRRGAIRPGITKKLVSATDVNGHVTQNPVSVNSNDILQWRIIADNDGTMALKDYVITDSMQSPYQFTGDVNYTIYTSHYDPDSPSNSNQTVTGGKLFTIESWENDGVNVFYIDKNGHHHHVKIPWGNSLGMSSFYLSSSKATFSVGFSIDEKTGNAVMSLRLSDERLKLYPGGSGVLTLNTKNPENTLTNKQFLNTAFITPMAQTWDHGVNKGNYTSYETLYGGAADSVRNSAPVSTAFGYATSAIKSVEEKTDSSNHAASIDDRNYIALSDASNEFIYTLTVNNFNDKAMDQLLFIDRLPEVGDHTVLDKNNPRNSEFKVSFAQTPNFEVIVTKKDGTTSKLVQGTDYTLQFSDKTEFTEADWSGDNTGWSDDRGTNRTVRLKINDETGNLIPPQSSVSLRFTCKVDDPNAKPGQIAWNAFGYQYSMKDDATMLTAAPLKVGVRIPTVPKLTKKLVDHRGATMTADKDLEFSFLVYSGEALPGTWQTAQELQDALTAAGKNYRLFTVTVPKDSSESTPVMLPENSTDGWKWVRKQPYTVVELPSDGNTYELRNFGLVTQNAYTFIYDPAADQTIACSNVNSIWDVELTKAEPAKNSASNDLPLPGAVFALYSLDPSDQITDVPADVSDTFEQNGVTWYLYSVKTSGSDGKIIWSNLNRAQYCLVEVKAPDGYKLPKENSRIISREDESQGTLKLTIYNHAAGYELPAAGGAGIKLYTVGGLLLIIAAGALLLYQKHSRRKEGHS